MLAVSSWLTQPADLVIILVGVAMFIPSARPFQRLTKLLTIWCGGPPSTDDRGDEPGGSRRAPCRRRGGR